MINMTYKDLVNESEWISSATQRVATINFVTTDKKRVNYYFNKDEPNLTSAVDFFLEHFTKIILFDMDSVLGKGFTQANPIPKHAHPHYFKYVGNLNLVDVYRVGNLFNVDDHGTGCIHHAIKKLLLAGQRGTKDQSQDVQEAIDTLTRYVEILKEGV
jgi:hypothetical protein